jgi:hypothetical protein
MASLGAFLLANWRWVLPLLAALGLAIDDGLHRVWLADCTAARAKDIADADRAALEQIKRDRDKRAEIDQQHQAEVDKIRQEASSRESEILKAARSTVCNTSGPFNALFNGVRREQDAAGGGKARPGATGR